MLPHNYFNDTTNLATLKSLILNPDIAMKEIQTKYGFSRQRLYQIITMHNLPTKHRTRRNKFKEAYGDNPIIYQLHHALNERKSHYNKKNGVTFQDATIDDLLIEGKLPILCPVFNTPLEYNVRGVMQDNTASIDKIDNTKGYIKGNVALISWRANKIKNEGTLTEHKQIIEYMLRNL